MTIDFTKLIEFNNKHPDINFTSYYFILINLMVSDDVSDSQLSDYILASEYADPEILYKDMENMGFIKITGDGYKDISIRDLGLELIGQSKSDSIIELAEKVREMFPKGIKSGGYPVRSSVVDVADKLRKFFKKHKYTEAQVLEATKRYVDRKRNEGYSYMQKAVFFIEKDGSSTLAAECDNLKDEENTVAVVDTMKRL